MDRNQILTPLLLILLAVTGGCAEPGESELPPPDAPPNVVEALNDQDAFAWWLRGARAGDARAQFMVGRFYKNGLGRRADIAAAFEWFSRSAEAGYLPAQIMVAEYYENGGPVDQSIDEAVFWHERAAAQGAVNTQFRLYLLHRGTDARQPDRVQAYKWLYIAAARGHGVAPDLLPDVELALSESEFETGKALAEEWLANH